MTPPASRHLHDDEHRVQFKDQGGRQDSERPAERLPEAEVLCNVVGGRIRAYTGSRRGRGVGWVDTCGPPRCTPDAGKLSIPRVEPKASIGAGKCCVARHLRGRLNSGRATLGGGGRIARQKPGVIERSSNASGSIGASCLRRLSSTLVSTEDGPPATPCRGKERDGKRKGVVVNRGLKEELTPRSCLVDVRRQRANTKNVY